MFMGGSSIEGQTHSVQAMGLKTACNHKKGETRLASPLSHEYRLLKLETVIGLEPDSTPWFIDLRCIPKGI